jgi:hypothetical protein|tara:strand:- start:344 stop:529 length:186 start_codon:yes stop_codon:yes gene_type:complete
MENIFNCLAKVVGLNDDGKNVVQIYKMTLEGNTLSYTEMKDIEPLDWDVAKKEFNVVGMIH